MDQRPGSRVSNPGQIHAGFILLPGEARVSRIRSRVAAACKKSRGSRKPRSVQCGCHCVSVTIGTRCKGASLIVPGAPYDPTTGKINAVGSDQLVAPDINLLGFSRAGDLRLTESSAQPIPALSTYGLLGLAVGLMSLIFLTIRSGRRSANTAADLL